jgi:hypothetical protein
MNPLGYWTDDSIPPIRIVLHSIYAPCLAGARAVALGHSLRKIIDQSPADLRNRPVGSGGLWHTPGELDAWLNEEFDQIAIKHLEAGDIQGWVAHFDAYVVPDDDKSQAFDVPSRGASGILPLMPGPQGGTREELDWIPASSMAVGSPFTIVVVINIYASPIHAGLPTAIPCDRRRLPVVSSRMWATVGAGPPRRGLCQLKSAASWRNRTAFGSPPDTSDDA